MGLGHDPSQDGRRPPGARRITDPKPTPCDRWPGCGCTLVTGTLMKCWIDNPVEGGATQAWAWAKDEDEDEDER